jgi:hypothetical protein
MLIFASDPATPPDDVGSRLYHQTSLGVCYVISRSGKIAARSDFMTAQQVLDAIRLTDSPLVRMKG